MNAVLARTTPEPLPVRLRPATGQSIGTTAFFRNRALLRTLAGRLAAIETRRISVLVHACSIGAEVWSLLISAALDARLRDKAIEIAATDIEAEFVAHAQRAVYPRAILAGMNPEEQSYFEPIDADRVRVCGELRERVHFLPARAVTDFETAEIFDVVLLLNALLYVPGELQSQALDSIARYNRHLLVTTGFHFDRIKADMLRNGYRPVNEAAQLIHDGWTDRRRNGPPRDETIPGQIFHSWSLPAYAEVEDFEFIYCSIFARHSNPAS